MTKILLIDDDVQLTNSLQKLFVRGGYEIDVANDGHTGISKALVNDYDVILLDVMMLGMNGWEVCEAIRKYSSIPIIMLTARDESVDRIRGLELGADDYLVKPLHFDEIHAHIQAIFRRIKITKNTHQENIYKFDGFVVDVNKRQVTKDNQPINLRRKEYDILFVLLTHEGGTVTREYLFDEIWGTQWLGDTRTLDVHISNLRAKFEDDPKKPKHIITVKGVGYRFQIIE